MRCERNTLCDEIIKISFQCNAFCLHVELHVRKLVFVRTQISDEFFKKPILKLWVFFENTFWTDLLFDPDQNIAD